MKTIITFILIVWVACGAYANTYLEQSFSLLGLGTSDFDFGLSHYATDSLTAALLAQPIATSTQLEHQLAALQPTASWPQLAQKLWNVAPDSLAWQTVWQQRKQAVIERQRQSKALIQQAAFYLPTLSPNIEFESIPNQMDDDLNFANQRRERMAYETQQKQALSVLDSLPQLAPQAYGKISVQTYRALNALAQSSLLNQARQFFHNHPQAAVWEHQLWLNDQFVQLVVGSTSNTTVDFPFDIYVDLGGNDTYRQTFAAPGTIQWIIDLAGDDSYGQADSSLASFCGEWALLDCSGNDLYSGKRFSVAATIGGISLLFDLAGNDRYQAEDFSIAAAKQGFSLLWDRSGQDTYSSTAYTQAFAGVNGLSYLIDSRGNDFYWAASPHEDVLRYKDHQLTMAQGFSIGERPFHRGGTAMLLDLQGDDQYHADVFGQGAAYWLATGVLADLSGNDVYRAKQYCQGAGVHLAVGLQFDFAGEDSYLSTSVSQGCGHDLSFGLLKDRSGKDTYVSETLSLGAGNANGFGLFIDETGNDSYLVHQPERSGGYGNPRREFGSLGIFLDESGDDIFAPAEWKNNIEIKSLRGFFWDVQDVEKP